MRGFQQMQRLSKGIISDRLGVPGALLEADDVVPLDRGEGFRTRGGKTATTITAGSGAPTWPTFTTAWALFDILGTAALPASQALLLYGAISGSYRFGLLSDEGRGWALPHQALDHAGSALTLAGRTNLYKSIIGYHNAALFHGEILVPYRAPDGIPLRYGGIPAGTAAFPYSTGTVSGSAGDSTLTGSGTSWTSSMLAGFVYINDADTSERPYRIVRVDSATSIELDRPLAGAVAAATSYRIDAAAPWVCKPGTFGAQNHTATITARSTVAAGGACVHQGRVIVWDTIDADNVRYPDRLRWCAPINETDGHWGGAELFDPNAFLDVFPGEGRANNLHGVQQCVSWQGALYVFKARALYVMRGYVATDGSDEGASLEFLGELDGVFESAQAIASDGGIVFATNRGIMQLAGSRIENLTERAGVGELYRSMIGSSVLQLSALRDRIVIQSGVSLATAAASGTPNTLVIDRKTGLVTTQTTIQTTSVREPWVTNVQAAVDFATGQSFVEWQDDNSFSSLVAEGGRYPTMRLTSHPIGLAQRGTPNARVRAMQVRAKVIDSDATDPVLGVTLLLGEQGTNTAVEAAIVATSDVEEQVTTEQWHRLKTVGTPPVDSVRVRLVQEKGSTDVRVTELGVEAVGVARFR